MTKVNCVACFPGLQEKEMGIKDYGVPGSPKTHGAMLGLAENGVEYGLITVPPSVRDAEHIAGNLLGHLSACEHDGFMLHETQAILCYVDQASASPAFRPANVRGAARMNQVRGIADCYLPMFWGDEIGPEQRMAPINFGRLINPDAIEAAVPMARCCAEALAALISVPHFTGETCTLADIRLKPHFDLFRQAHEGETILACKRRLAECFQHISERLSAKKILQPI